jgi:hypothetical protein
VSIDEDAVARAAVSCWLLDSEARAAADAFASQLANDLGM